MPHEMEDNKNFNIRILADGNFVLSSGGAEYAYEKAEELLQDLKSDLMNAVKGDSEKTEKRKKVKAIMEDEDEE